jgi:hypothetical protein
MLLLFSCRGYTNQINGEDAAACLVLPACGITSDRSTAGAIKLSCLRLDVRERGDDGIWLRICFRFEMGFIHFVLRNGEDSLAGICFLMPGLRGVSA